MLSDSKNSLEPDDNEKSMRAKSHFDKDYEQVELDFKQINEDADNAHQLREFKKATYKKMERMDEFSAKLAGYFEGFKAQLGKYSDQNEKLMNIEHRMTKLREQNTEFTCTIE